MSTRRSQLVEAPAVPVSRRLPAEASAVKTAPADAPALATTRQALISLPATDDQVRTARKFASHVLGHWLLAPDDRDSAVLIISELATNASRYGRSEMTVSLTLRQQILNIAVSDTGRPCPTSSEPACADPDEHGRGLDIVELLAHWFAIRETDNGYRVDVDVLLTDLES
ncbi:ATP-binding protein [Kitasatospora sp. NBC_00240]|uniref:ATP-binding protein n=1 Tax=Kitasatospora sp. NBC_00240 TaxID=2903567 RepID=UPI00225BE425|nr:ATP-binding protein [Kitasatospora sp. NBC_00240]MCX5215499.1 ATP-binding protein [Kitasatospora sp. NBC_00240]